MRAAAEVLAPALPWRVLTQEDLPKPALIAAFMLLYYLISHLDATVVLLTPVVLATAMVLDGPVDANAYINNPSAGLRERILAEARAESQNVIPFEPRRRRRIAGRA